jgi:Tol biopolymer transport system component
MRPSRRSSPPAASVPSVVLALAIIGLSCTSRNTGPASQSPPTPTAASPSLSAPSTAGSPAGPSSQPRGPRIRLSSLRGRVAFDCGDDVCIADVDGSHVRRLTNRRGPEFDATWSPDGSRVAYRDSRRGINNNDEIYVVNADGSGRRNLTQSPSNDWGPDWSPDGRLIAFNSDVQLYVMRPNGTHRRRITDVEAEYPSWSPDGRWIAFMSAQPDARGSDPNYDVFVVNRNGSGLKQLTEWPGEDGWPAWSPNGKWIAFTTTHDAAGRYLGGIPYRDVYVMRPDGTRKRRIVVRLTGEMPVWSPDGRVIMFTGSHLSTPGKRYLWVVRPDGSGLRRLPIRGYLPDWIDH